MSEEKAGSLVKIGDIDLAPLGKAAEKLIDVLSRGIGLAYKPIHEVRMAKARATVAEVRESSRQELDDIVWNRMVANEKRRQSNAESIVALALPHMEADCSDEPPSEDWLNRFFADSEDVSNEQLQELWARLLAREVSSPGRVSKRTLSLVKDLSSVEAQLFSSLAALTWVVDDSKEAFVLHAWPHTTGVAYPMGPVPLDTFGLPTRSILELRSLGLIMDSDATVSLFDTPLVTYAGRKYSISIERPESCDLCVIPLSRVGCELLGACHVEQNDSYLAACVRRFGASRIAIKPIGS